MQMVNVLLMLLQILSGGMREIRIIIVLELMMKMRHGALKENVLLVRARYSKMDVEDAATMFWFQVTPAAANSLAGMRVEKLTMVQPVWLTVVITPERMLPVYGQTGMITIIVLSAINLLVLEIAGRVSTKVLRGLWLTCWSGVGRQVVPTEHQVNRNVLIDAFPMVVGFASVTDKNNFYWIYFTFTI